MSDFDTVLPPNQPSEMLAIEQVIGEGMSDLATPISELWNADRCPAAMLPWLAWATSIDVWTSDWSETTKRDAIKASFEVHRWKGTRHGVQLALAAAGYGSATIVEGFNTFKFDGSYSYDGVIDHGTADHWAEYRIYLQRPISIKQANEVREILALVAPVRSHLAGIVFDEAQNLYDATITYDGTFSHGVA